MSEFAHLKATADDDQRAPGFGESSTTTERFLMDKIKELEAQVADISQILFVYKEDLIDALQDVINYAPPCTSSIEYAEKRLKELL
jgi:hypothetical protein